MNLSCGHCQHEADITEFETAPVTGQLPENHYQCPNCKRAWRVVRTNVTVTRTGYLINPPNRIEPVGSFL